MLEVYVSKENFKFNCAHFIAYRGFRERLHGHNYRVGVRIRGTKLGPDGYLMDFGDIKNATRGICSSLNEYFLCPLKSDVINVAVGTSSVEMQCEDGSRFIFPANDCKLLPVKHTSAEEIAHYIYCQLIRFRAIGFARLLERGVSFMEVDVSEADKQTAIFRHAIPSCEEDTIALEGCFESSNCCIPCVDT